MSILAGEWWEADPWWQFGLTLVVGFLVGVIGAWATLRASNPKRRINWWVESNTSLLSLSEQPDDGRELTVHLDGTRVENPRVVELVIANVGSRDITASMFHADQAVRFDFGSVTVMGIVARHTLPEGTVLPSLEIESVSTIGLQPPVGGNWLDVKPCLLKRGQTVLITALVNGEEQKVKCSSAGLVDVEVASAAPARRSQAVADALSGVTLYLGPFPIRLGGFRD
ncbi:hypothetical protein [Streptomyces microflavus]|uniref:hypothetical protein n=1 Tax=Streptomyces microflavus TaxID=1919 RepID=UPI003411AAF5